MSTKVEWIFFYALPCIVLILKLANRMLPLSLNAGDTSEADMRLPIAFGFFYFFVLVVIFSWACEVNNYHWVKSENDQVLCGTSPPNKTLKAVISRVHCVSSCNHGCPSSPCQAINYWKSAQLCQQFYYRPCSYAVQEGCENYQVATTEFWSFVIKHSYNIFFLQVLLACT